MKNTTLIAELQTEIGRLHNELRKTNDELALWEYNGVLLTSKEKQCFYTRYRDEQRQKRQHESEQAVKELERLTTRILVRKDSKKNDESI